jgi:hypothetical protein
MKPSEKIIEWSDNCRKVNADMSTFADDLREVTRHTYPLADTERLRGMAGTNATSLKIVEAWEALSRVWDSCPQTDTPSRFQALYHELDKGGYPEFIRGLIDGHAKVAFDQEKARQLYDRAKALETKSRDLGQRGKELGKELTDNVSGKMVFSLDAEPKPNYEKLSIFGYVPYTLLAHHARITAFPRQSMANIARRWLAGANVAGFNHFSLLGYMGDEHLTTLPKALGDIKGDTRDAKEVIGKVSLRGVKSLWLLLTDTTRPDCNFGAERNWERIDFDRHHTTRGSIYLGPDLLFERDAQMAPGRLYVHEIGKVLDAVVDSYKK